MHTLTKSTALFLVAVLVITSFAPVVSFAKPSWDEPSECPEGQVQQGNHCVDAPQPDHNNDGHNDNGNDGSGGSKRTISGTVFNDVNQNDAYDSGEPKLEGWTVLLHEGSDGYNSPVVATDVTDADGAYFFGDLSNGDYFVEEIEQSGWDQTTSDRQVHVQGHDDKTVDFANVMIPQVWVPEVGGLIVKKIVVGGNATPNLFSFSLNGGEAITFDVSGSNSFFNMATGTYSVVETATTTYTATYDNCSGTIAANATSTCTITNTYVAPATSTDTTGGGSGTTGGGSSNENTPATTDTGTSGGGGGGYVASGPLSIGFVNTNTPGGVVLGTSTEALPDGCSALLTTYLRQGKKNDKNEVTKLQNFLNKELGLSIPVTGFFGTQTTMGVNAFQEKYGDEVLTPWKPFGWSGKATGYVYKTTQRKINLVVCSTLNIPVPQLP